MYNFKQMNKNINILLESLLKESVYSIEDVKKAIQNQVPITIAKTIVNEKGSTIATFNVVPEEISEDIIIGESKERGRVEFKLEDVEAILFLNEDSTPGVHMTSKALGNMDTNKLGALAQKASIEITEEEEPLEGDEVFDYIKRDIQGEQVKPEEIEKENQQELAIFNIKNWANQLEIDLGNIHNFNKGVEEFQFIIEEKPYSILIYNDGTIRLSGHTIKTYDDFKKVFDFMKTY